MLMHNFRLITPVKDRILLIDIIRGFALFGILLVNTPTLNSPALLDTDDFGFKSTLLDTWVTKFIFTFAMESFYPIFALLFGLGAAIFLSKNGQRAAKLFWRRMFFLLCLGMLHALFVWWGDILIVYAILGSLLPFFAQRETRALGKITLAMMICVLLLGLLHGLWPSVHVEKVWPDTASIYAQGTFFEISWQRAHDYVQVFFLNAAPLETFTYFLNMLGIMLLGMWVHRLGILTDKEPNQRSIARIAVFSFVFAASYLVFNELGINIDPLRPFRGLCIGIFYLSVLALLSMTRRGFLILKPLASNGRMSLSNYLGFNIALSLIFYGYGFGLYGSLGPAALMPIVLVLYGSALLFSSLWLKHFPYGPCEWLWRLFTYGPNAKKRTVATE